MGILGSIGDVHLSEKHIKKAKAQIVADFETSMREFNMSVKDASPFRVFCLGITMNMLTLKGYSEDGSVLPSGMTMEEAIESYYEAARRGLHAD
jgi:uncharacterized protein YccT (UPF0319 family)